MDPEVKKDITKNFLRGLGISLGANIVLGALWATGADRSGFSGGVLLFLQPVFFITAVVLGLKKVKVGMASGLVTGIALTILSVPAMCFGMIFMSSYK
jgi:hypothetical protein